MIQAALAINSLCNGSIPASFIETFTNIVGELTSHIQKLEAKIEILERSQDQSHEVLAIDIAQDRQRITKLESKTPEPTKKTLHHIDELRDAMVENKVAQVSVATGAKLLGLSKERVRQLKPLIMADGHFDLKWDRLKGQRPRVVIKLRQFIGGT